MNLPDTVQLLGAAGSFLVGIAALITAVYRVRRVRHSPNQKEEQGALRPFQPYVLIGLAGIVAILYSGKLLIDSASGQGSQPPNVQLTTAAWAYHNAGDFRKAIAKAKQCIDRFEGAALIEQELLREQRAPQPAEGLANEEQKKVVTSRGLLNDVATAYFIAGSSAEALGRLEDARQHYQRAAKFTYARTWDPKGWFWSPATAAEKRLAVLK